MSGLLTLTWMIVAPLGLALSLYTFIHDTLPRMRAEHRARQECRLFYDGYAPPWWMGWAYWIGVDKIVLRSKIARAKATGSSQ